MAGAGFPEVADLPSRPEWPDPLVFLDGRRVSTHEDWAQRKAELRDLFQAYMYGRLPSQPRFTLMRPDRVDAGYLGGKATRKDLTIAIRLGQPRSTAVNLLVVIPNKRTRPAPVVLGTNFHGNHTALNDPTIPLPTAWMPAGGPGVVANKATDAGRGKEVGVWSIEAAVDRGYAVATFYCGDVVPDRPLPGIGAEPQAPREVDQAPALAAWAWGLMRAVDALRGDPDLDKNRIIVVGHSRMGKAALLAGAFDDRVALTIAHQAGCGGSAPSRGKVGEQVKQINDRFPHWFGHRFKEFNDNVDRLPFDQHCLVALAAPRRVLFTNATEDTWANPAGQFDVLKAADPVYRLLGVAGIDPAAPMPPVDTPVGDRLAYQIRPGKHSMEPRDWTVWLDHADKHLGKP